MTHFQHHLLFVNMPFTKEDNIPILSWKVTMLGI